MKRPSDLECLYATAMHVCGHSDQVTLHGDGVIARGLALIDEALVRVLHRWRPMDDGTLVVPRGKIYRKMMPKLAREARRRLGR